LLSYLQHLNIFYILFQSFKFRFFFLPNCALFYFKYYFYGTYSMKAYVEFTMVDSIQKHQWKRCNHTLRCFIIDQYFRITFEWTINKRHEMRLWSNLYHQAEICFVVVHSSFWSYLSFEGNLQELWVLKPRYEIRYGYDTAQIRRYRKISKIKIRYGWDTLINITIFLICKYINKQKKLVIGS
jgi:hypothetical protein